MTTKQLNNVMTICFIVLIASLFVDKGSPIRVVLDVTLFIGWSLCSLYNPVRLIPYGELETLGMKMDKIACHALPIMGAYGAIMSVLEWWK